MVRGIVRGTGETQPARTALAWQRTGLGVLVVAALLARQSVVSGQAGVVVPAGVVALLGLLVLGVLAARRERSARAAESGGPGSDRSGARAVTGVVVLTAGAALVTELLLRR